MKSPKPSGSDWSCSTKMREAGKQMCVAYHMRSNLFRGGTDSDACLSHGCSILFISKVPTSCVFFPQRHTEILKFAQPLSLFSLTS